MWLYPAVSDDPAGVLEPRVSEAEAVAVACADVAGYAPAGTLPLLAVNVALAPLGDVGFCNDGLL